MKTISSDSPCPVCSTLRAEVDALKHLLLEMRQQFDALQDELSQTQAELAKRQAELAKARKNSSNSSKGRRKRKIDGQRGNTKHERTFCLGDADEKHTYSLDTCPKCSGTHLETLPGAEKISYQYELVDQSILLHAHQIQAYWCPHCQEIHHASLPTICSSTRPIPPVRNASPTTTP